jgi:shikimate kinase
MSENIILIGFMGTGKDTIGRLLAERLNMGFISTDEMIELAEQRTIERVFEEDGEDYFRKKEKWVLKEIEGLKNVVIGTGGGMVIDLENRALLKKMGIVIQLSANPDTLKKRIIAQGKRPLIKKISDIERLYQKRSGIYDFALIKVDTTEREPDGIVDEIILRSYTAV